MMELAAEIRKTGQYTVDETPWGSLTWFASKQMGNARHLTVGQCKILPGKQNPRHHHPNCEEVLHVLQGRIKHSYGDESAEMNAGDTITVPAGIPHNAVNIGDGEAIMMITFSSSERLTIGE